MKRWVPTGTRLAQATLGVAIGLLAVAGLYVSIMLSQRQEAMSEVSSYNVAFSASQGVSEYMRLRQRLGAMILNPLSSKEKQEVVLRFEILQNRLNLFKSGEFGQFVHEKPEREAILMKIGAMLDRIEPIIRSPSDTGQVLAALRLTKPLEEDFIGLASEANYYGGAAVAADQMQMFKLHWTFTAVTLLLSFCGGVLFLLSRRQNKQLASAQQSLATANGDLAGQNLLFEAALDNMSQGLCMFDAAHRLIVSNRRMAAIYNLSEKEVASGVSLRQLSESMVESGACSWDRASTLHRELQEVAVRGKPETLLAELADGRIVLVSCQPMEGGGWTATHEDITERHRALEQVEHMARHDTLTGLPNRVLLRERLEETLSRDKEEGLSTAVLCLDLDNFKNINDTFGHPFGDLLIREVAERVQAVFRSVDTVCRVGGDEFTVVYGGMKDIESVEAVAKMLIASLAEPYSIGQHRVISGGSVGIAVGCPAAAEADVLLKNADMALYDAKAAGKGTFFLLPRRHGKADGTPPLDRVQAARGKLRRAVRDRLPADHGPRDRKGHFRGGLAARPARTGGSGRASGGHLGRRGYGQDRGARGMGNEECLRGGGQDGCRRRSGRQPVSGAVLARRHSRYGDCGAGVRGDRSGSEQPGDHRDGAAG